MEHCNKGEISNLKMNGQRRDKQFKSIFRQLLYAIQYLQEKKILHRDIKPENVMLHKVGEKLTLKLIDFGLSTKFDFSFKPSNIRICGTPGFIAPEILDPKVIVTEDSLIEKSDIYSAGVLLYYKKCGHLPIEGKDFQELLDNNIRGDVNFSSIDFKSLEPDLKSLLRSMLARNPEDRIGINEALEHPYLDIEENLGKSLKVNRLNFNSDFSTQIRKDITQKLEIGKENTDSREGFFSDIREDEANCGPKINEDLSKIQVLGHLTVMKNKFSDISNFKKMEFSETDEYDIESEDEENKLIDMIKNLKNPTPKLILA